jgi:hypothetical protein
MDTKPHVWGRIVMTCCTVKKEVVAFGGTLEGLDGELSSSHTWMLAFEGLDVTYLTYDITLMT